MNRQAEYVDRLTEHLAEWDVQIDLIKGRTVSIPPQTRMEFSKAVTALQLKRDEVAASMQGIPSASDDDWEKIKNGTEHILGEVRDLFRAAITTFEWQTS